MEKIIKKFILIGVFFTPHMCLSQQVQQMPSMPIQPIAATLQTLPAQQIQAGVLPQQPAAFVVPPAPAPQLPVSANPTPKNVPPVQKPQNIAIAAQSNNKKNAKNKKGEDIYLNFQDASLTNVVDYLGEQKKINIIPHKDLEGIKVNLTTHHPLTLERAWDVLLTLLEMNGFTLINVDKIYRVVPSANNGQEPLPTYSSGTGTEPDDLPDSDLVVRYVYFFKSIKTDVAKSILSKMIDEKNIIDNKDLNACIIKDQCLNIKSAMRIVKELDNSGLREAIEVIPLTWANCDTVAKLFGEVLGTDKEERIIRFTPNQKESQYFSQSTRIIPEPVKNALILIGTQKNITKIKTFIYKYIDLPIDDAESRLHIKELRYVRAQDMKPILEEIIKPPKGAGTEKAVVLEGGYKIFEDVIISAEVDDDSGDAVTKRGGGNRLIIACNKDDWKRLEEFIDKIDKPQPQVAMEVMIIDASIGEVRRLGAQLYNIKGKPIAHNVSGEADNLSAGQLQTPPSANNPVKISQPFIKLGAPDIEGNESASYITLGRAGNPADGNAHENIWAFIKAVMRFNNAHVISQPYIIANNNQKCSESVKTIIRTDGQIDTKTIQAVQKKEDLTAEIKVELTPTINLIGTIDLTVDISIDEFINEDPVTNPTRTIRKLTTRASMGAGEVLSIGGLTRSMIVEEVEKTPILGDIPFLGMFFKNKVKNKEERNLYVFIRPSIIKPRFEGAPDEYTQLKLDYAKYQIMKNDMYVHDRDPIQRWFFRPSKQSIKHKLTDAARGIYRPIDDFTYGRSMPKSVNIQEDPYFKVSESVAKAQEKREAGKIRHAPKILDQIPG